VTWDQRWPCRPTLGSVVCKPHILHLRREGHVGLWVFGRRCPARRYKPSVKRSQRIGTSSPLLEFARMPYSTPAAASAQRVSCASRPLDPARPAPTPLPARRHLWACERPPRQVQRARAGRAVRNRQAWRVVRTVPRPGGGPTRPPRRTLLPVCPDRRACGRESAVVQRRKSARRCHRPSGGPTATSRSNS